MKKASREWMRKAESDYRLAETIAHGSEPFPDQLCFHCQQSAEKYLKALLEEAAAPIPKTHDLEHLLRLLVPVHPTLRALRRGLLFLTDFAIDTRYPGNWTTNRQATAAMRWAQRIREACRTQLGVPPQRKKSP